ncbi:hypothetical protein CY34DRAFT_285895 [Suillus luteus UH-Slu-Lm8-n1]|uniref:Uncharacterized protein n=1 Tax=Suillus luteus UH-Slu-Lm8-n1 TaxID=930992 RepID=A0A0D0AQ18_9AGAM|nr:hypothetical protein CY34DRAFT_285895 [Suillus luteus UH-Slu-Lm8-n1]
MTDGLSKFGSRNGIKLYEHCIRDRQVTDRLSEINRSSDNSIFILCTNRTMKACSSKTTQASDETQCALIFFGIDCLIIVRFGYALRWTLPALFQLRPHMLLSGFF